MPAALQAFLTAIVPFTSLCLNAWDGAATAALNARLDAIRKAGDPVTMAELGRLYRDPPKGQNAAPILRKAFRQMKAIRLTEEMWPTLPIVGTAVHPDHHEDMPPAMRRAVRVYLKENAEILRLLHKAVALDGCKFDLDFTKPLPIHRFSGFRQASRLLSMEAMQFAELGKPAQAARSLAAAIKIATLLKNEPLLGSGLVQGGCQLLPLGQLERLVCRLRVPDEDLKQLQTTLRAALDLKFPERGLVGNRCYDINFLSKYALKPGGREALLKDFQAAREHMEKAGIPLDAMGMEFPPVEALVWLPRVCFKLEMIAQIDRMSRLITIARMPYPKGLQAGAREGAALRQSIPRWQALSRYITPGCGVFFWSTQETLARLDSTRTALAVLRYQAKHRALPDTLAAVVPQFLDAVPTDPFSGQSLLYRRTDDGFVVYAVGRNSRDDGGRLKWDKQSKSRPDVGFRVRLPKGRF